MSNFWRSLDFPSINCEIELDLRWAKDCIISGISRTFRVVDPNANPVVYQVTSQTTSATFQINNAKRYVQVVTLSINDNNNFLENIKKAMQPKNNNLDFLIDPTFRNINRLFVLYFRNGNNDPTRDSFDKYYMPLVKIRDLNALIDNKPFFDQSFFDQQTRSM